MARSALLVVGLVLFSLDQACGLASVDRLRAPSNFQGMTLKDASLSRRIPSKTVAAQAPRHMWDPPTLELFDNELRGGGGVVDMWQKYEALLDKEPLKTRVWTGFFISIVGDIICQYLTKDNSPSWKLDLKRMLIFASWGAIGFTPLAYKWYGGMENIVPATLPYRFLIKTALDQTIFSSGVTTITFITLTLVEGLLVGFDWKMGSMPASTKVAVLPIGTIFDQGVQKVKDLLWPTLLENWKVWPAVQLLNFSVVPVKFQVLFVNCVAIWWNFVLSLMQHK